MMNVNNRWLKYAPHLRRMSGPMAQIVYCVHCRWFQKTRERGYGPASKLQAAGIAHLKQAHPDRLEGK